LLEEGAHGKSPKCLGGNLGDFGEFCKGLKRYKNLAASDKRRPKQIKRATQFLGISTKKKAT
ncbi:hypothetical protein, partial [Neisseria mucosa]|uniref:hypothetical protein n=1 Tax=Neisseria mucosa TaxID=488 RepID=UPI00280BB2E5